MKTTIATTEAMPTATLLKSIMRQRFPASSKARCALPAAGIQVWRRNSIRHTVSPTVIGLDRPDDDGEDAFVAQVGLALDGFGEQRHRPPQPERHVDSAPSRKNTASSAGRARHGRLRSKVSNESARVSLARADRIGQLQENDADDRDLDQLGDAGNRVARRNCGPSHRWSPAGPGTGSTSSPARSCRR